MNREDVRIFVEIYSQKAVRLAKVGIRFAAVIVIFIAIFNLFGPHLGFDALTIYPRENLVIVDEKSGIYLEDVAVMSIGLIVGWLV